MKKLILFFTLWISLGVSAQTLTNAQVFDFQPGDVFQISHLSPGNCFNHPPASIWTDSVTSKNFSFTGDSVIYVIHEEVYTPQSCPPPCTASVSNSTFTVCYDITQNAGVSFNHCGPITTGIYNDTSHCGYLTWFERSVSDSTCFEIVSADFSFIEGCGGPYYNVVDISNSVCNSHSLFYSKKGTTTCGTYYYHNPVTAIEENTVRNITAYPNPSANQLNFTGDTRNLNYTLCDILGKTLQNGSIENSYIDISSLEKGCYTVILHSPINQTTTLKFIKN